MAQQRQAFNAPRPHSQASPQHLLLQAPGWATEGYKECSILPTLLMTLFSLFCMSSSRLYQLSDSEVTSPAKDKMVMRVQGSTQGSSGTLGPRCCSCQQAGSRGCWTEAGA